LQCVDRGSERETTESVVVQVDPLRLAEDAREPALHLDRAMPCRNAGSGEHGNQRVTLSRDGGPSASDEPPGLDRLKRSRGAQLEREKRSSCRPPLEPERESGHRSPEAVVEVRSPGALVAD